MEIETHHCISCEEPIQAACFLELQARLAKHVCAKMPNRRIQRTAQLQQDLVDEFVNDTAVNRIEASNRQRLIQQGILVNA